MKKRVEDNKVRNLVFVLIFLAMNLCSCESRLEHALSLAGENRPELEKVLEHYRKEEADSLKLRAAQFLIENMPYHYALGGEAVEEYDAAYVEMAKVPLSFRDSVFAQYAKLIDMSKKTLCQDVRTLKADYLIHHIDMVCEQWKKMNWRNEYPLSVFLEYVLPYRLVDEPISYWRDSLQSDFRFLNESVLWSLRGSAYEAEDGMLEGCDVVSCPSAAGNRAVTLFNPNSALHLDFNQPLPVRKLLYISYATDVRNSSIDVLLNGKLQKRISLTPTFSMSSFNIRRAYVALDMEKGSNRVTVRRNTGKCVIDIFLVGTAVDFDAHNMKDYTNSLWRISNHATGCYITFDTLNSALLTKVKLLPSLPTDSCSFLRLDCKGFESWRIAAFKHDSIDLCLDVLNYLPDAGTPIMQWKDVGGNNQRWMIIPSGHGLYRIMGRDSGLCLESIKDEQTGEETMAIKEYEGAPTQLWRIEPVGVNPHADTTIQYGRSIAAAFRIYDVMPLYEWFLFEGQLPLKTTSLCKYLTGNCRDETSLIVHLARYMGVPATADFTPQWGNRSMSHTWSVLVNPDGKATKFYMGTTPGDTTKTFTDYRRPKVFRRRFSINGDILKDFEGVSDVPDLFHLPTFTDVTEEYGDVTDITRPIPRSLQKEKIAYICVFDNQNWVITHYGKIENGRVTFRKMGRDIAYMTAQFVNGKTIPIGNPYILTKSGEVVELEADETKVMSMSLERKYPFFGVAELFNWGMWGGRFQGSNDPDFARATDLFVYNGITNGNWYEFPVTEKKPFRFFRYYGPAGSHCYVNEIEFIGADGKPLTGDVIGTKGEPHHEKETVFDGNILTGFRAATADSNWVGLRLQRQESVKKLRFISRNDGNCIEAGDEYELVYWADEHWKRAGQQTASSNILTFQNVPTGALYLLHDRTKGREERIFTYNKKDGQKWW